MEKVKVNADLLFKHGEGWELESNEFIGSKLLQVSWFPDHNSIITLLI